MAQIRLEQVTRTFGTPRDENLRDDRFEETEHESTDLIYALNQVSLTIPDGKATVIIGPSGCGKSTLLRVVAGLDSEYTGHVYYDGRAMGNVSPGDRDIGMVFQNYALYPHFHGQNNMRFTFWVRKAPDAEAEARIRATAEIMGFGFNQLLPRRPGTLSGGQQQRLAIARALVRNPSLFLLDEPLANLDAKLRAQTRVEIKRLLQRFKITTIYVTHDQEEAISLADQIVVMRKGKVEQMGTPTYLRAEPVNIFVAGFFGAYPMNLIEGQVGEEGVLQIGATQLPLPATVREQVVRGQAVTLGTRPEELSLVWGMGQEAQGPHLRGSVLAVEPDFARRIQYARIETEQGLLTVAETSTEPLPLTQNVAVLLPQTPSYLFDTASEARL